MNKLLPILTLFWVSCSNSKKNNENTSPSRSEAQLDEIKDVALSFHLWYIKNTNGIESNIPTDFIVTKGKNDSCMIDYEPYFNELRKLGTISNSFLKSEKERTRPCAEAISKMNWEQYMEGIPKNCDDYLFWTRSQDETSGIELVNLKEENGTWKAKFKLYNTFDNEKHYTPYTGIINVRKEKDKFMITRIKWS